MGRAWTGKDERQYEHIKESSIDRGVSTERAQEIAARTVNKERREEGRTLEQNQRAGSSSEQNFSGGKSLGDRTKDELYKEAKKLHIHNRSQMNKSQLVRAIQKHH